MCILCACAGFIALLVITAMGCGLQNLCRSQVEEQKETFSSGQSLQGATVSSSVLRDEGWVHLVAHIL